MRYPRLLSIPLSFTASGRRRWVVARGSRRRVVDLEWPGFSNRIAVDGAVIDSTNPVATHGVSVSVSVIVIDQPIPRPFPTREGERVRTLHPFPCREGDWG